MKNPILIPTLAALIAFGPALLGQAGTPGSPGGAGGTNNATGQYDGSSANSTRQNRDQRDANTSSYHRDQQKHDKQSEYSHQGKQDRLKVTQASVLQGYDVFDQQGEKVGDITDFVLNLQDGRVTHLVVSSGGWFDTGWNGEKRLVPVNNVQRQGDRFTLQQGREQFMQQSVFEGDLDNASRNWSAQANQSSSARNNAQNASNSSRSTTYGSDGAVVADDITNPNSSYQSTQRIERSRTAHSSSLSGSPRDGDLLPPTAGMSNTSDQSVAQNQRDRQNDNAASSQNRSNRAQQGMSGNMANNSSDQISSRTHVLFSKLDDIPVNGQDQSELAEVTDALVNIDEGRVSHLIVRETNLTMMDERSDIVAIPVTAIENRSDDEISTNLSADDIRGAEFVENLDGVRRADPMDNSVYIIGDLNRS